MQILDGKIASAAIKEKLKLIVEKRKAENKKTPHLAVIIVGNDGASETYVSSKVKTSEELGFGSTLVRMDADIPEALLLDQIKTFNDSIDIDGILVQLPLPKHISEARVIEAIDPAKDVDGFHPVSAGRLVQGLETFVPATPYGIMLMLEHFGVETTGKHAVVIGRSNIVGRPMSILLSSQHPFGNCTVTVCHSKTKDLASFTRQADIVVAALGKPEFLKADMVKDGAVVIDVGITRVPDATKKKGFAIKGDVAFEEVAPKTSWITPVPGGVGLMTIGALMMNTLKACERKD
ncbi:MAG: bifunctional 5,10-methylenetetrahydrofolate dehydrogenase/5,10-methenyltetrahydrofolate cyclohydrolase [Chitinophagaceae bacterium]|jgi:methylenetetrahydrofolate dehydrogenase (NADP+)/methenyltetrahydrofolate cyclohydrolase|nr:bifunctional 5,10-methylenetetrahydrofolate dehydrogenase/5,10-methenyltetrahydrofolate cyclohydrolase [Chitinophagaceae bacterium]